MAEKVFNWAFVGTGRMARNAAKSIIGSGRHKIVSVYSRSFRNAERFSRAFGGETYDSVENAVAAPNADGVYICVTNNAHYDCCLRALRSGKAILSEKPFTTDAAQARALFEIAARQNTYLCEAMWTWFSEQAHAVKAAIASGAIGNVTGGEISFCLPIAFGKNNRLKSSAAAGGALLDLGVYPIAYAYRLFGKPNKITCSAKFKYRVDMHDDIIFDYGAFAVKIKTSVRGVGEKLKITGERGEITAGAFHSGGAVKIKSNGKVARIPSDKNLLLTEFDKAAAEIRAGKTQSEFVSPSDTVAVMELLDDIRRAIGLKYSFEN